MVSAGTIFTNDRFPRATTPDLDAPAAVRAGRAHPADPRARGGDDRRRLHDRQRPRDRPLRHGRHGLGGDAVVPDFHLVVGHPARRSAASAAAASSCSASTARDADRLREGDLRLLCQRAYAVRSAARCGRIDDRAARPGALGRRRRRDARDDARPPPRPARAARSRCSTRRTSSAASPPPGSLDGVVWDRHYHVTLLSDLHLRALWAELGLEGELRWVETRTGFYTGGRLHSVSNSARVPPLPAPAPDRQAAPRRHHPPRLARQGPAPAGSDPGERLAAALVGGADVRDDLAAAAQGQARRELPARPRRPSSGPPSPACTPPAAPGSRRRCSATCAAATPASSTASRRR